MQGWKKCSAISRGFRHKYAESLPAPSGGLAIRQAYARSTSLLPRQRRPTLLPQRAVCYDSPPGLSLSMGMYAVDSISVEVDGPGKWPCSWRMEDGRYKMLRQLGKGSYGAVHACVDTSTGKELAAKVIKKETGEKEVEALNRIKNEIDILDVAKGCVYLVRVVDVVQDSSAVHIITEHIRGDSLLERMLRLGKLSEAEAASSLHDILQLLHHLHGCEIIHGDVKPANFIHCRTPEHEATKISAMDWPCSHWPARNILKAIDCGCSRFVDQVQKGETGAGTPVYTAPEVFMKAPCMQSDMWSVGMMLCEMLSGKLPFWTSMKGLTPRDVLIPILRGEVNLDHPVWTDISPEAKDLVYKLLERDVEKRLTPAEALTHPWIQKWHNKPCTLPAPFPQCDIKSHECWEYNHEGVCIVAEGM